MFARNARPLLALLLAIPFAAFLGGCSEFGSGRETKVEGEEALQERRTPERIDSIFPIEEHLRRFRLEVPEVTTLSGGEGSAEALVERFIRSVEQADTLDFGRMVMDLAEFGWLYYPHTQYTSRPYELAPSLVWFNMQNRSSRGLTRALDRYAGRTLYYTGFACPEEDVEMLGENRLHHYCTVLGRLPDGEEVEERVFGSIIERDGHFKFVSYSNEF